MKIVRVCVCVRVCVRLKAMRSAAPDNTIFAIDVECVATGIRSNDRATARIVLVNTDLETVFDCFVKPAKPVVSCLTDLTGVTPADLDAADPLDRVRAKMCQVRVCLSDAATCA